MKRSAQLDTKKAAPPAAEAAARPPADGSSARLAAAIDPARYGQDLQDRYIAARDAWTRAMHTAGSGRPADLASLAIAQQAYEEVAAERERWLATGRVAIPIQPAAPRQDIEIAVGQEMAWRQVHEQSAQGGLLARIRRRFARR
jgi:hypothetical protein